MMDQDYLSLGLVCGQLVARSQIPGLFGNGFFARPERVDACGQAKRNNCHPILVISEDAPSHPFLEARLNATHAACYPFQEDWTIGAHIVSAPIWLREAELKKIRSRTFVADVQPTSRAEMILLLALKCYGGKRHLSLQIEIGCSFKGSPCHNLVIS